MKLVSPQLELRVVRTLASTKSQKEAAKLFAQVNEDCFYTRAARDCYNRIYTVLRQRGTLMTWGELYSDPVISENVRNKLKKFKEKPIPFDSLDKAVNLLHGYRRMRLLLDASDHIVKSLNKSKVDIDKLTADVSQKMTEAKLGGDISKWFFHVGAKDKSDLKQVRALLKPDSKRFIPTGFNAFDRINHGIPRGSFLLIAGPTGAGKSALAGQLARNMATMGVRVNITPLEMKNDEMMQRELSRTSSIDMQKIINPKDLTDIEKAKVIKRYKKLRDRIRMAGGQLSLFAPEEDLSLEEILFATEPMEFDVDIIDYIGLLKGVDGDDQWRAMRNVTRFAKRYASIKNKVIVICAQLSAEGLLRYSRGMLEDASNAFFMQPNERTQETGIMLIDQPKARNQKKFKFPLYFNYATQAVRDLTDGELNEFENEGKSKNPKKKGKGNTKVDDEFFEED